MGSKKSTEIIVRVTRPELTQEERGKRMEEIKKAATALVVATMKNRSRPSNHLPA